MSRYRPDMKDTHTVIVFRDGRWRRGPLNYSSEAEAIEVARAIDGARAVPIETAEEVCKEGSNATVE